MKELTPSHWTEAALFVEAAKLRYELNGELYRWLQHEDLLPKLSTIDGEDQLPCAAIFSVVLGLEADLPEDFERARAFADAQVRAEFGEADATQVVVVELKQMLKQRHTLGSLGAMLPYLDDGVLESMRGEARLDWRLRATLHAYGGKLSGPVGNVHSAEPHPFGSLFGSSYSLSGTYKSADANQRTTRNVDRAGPDQTSQAAQLREHSGTATAHGSPAAPPSGSSREAALKRAKQTSEPGMRLERSFRGDFPSPIASESLEEFLAAWSDRAAEHDLDALEGLITGASDEIRQTQHWLDHRCALIFFLLDDPSRRERGEERLRQLVIDPDVPPKVLDEVYERLLDVDESVLADELVRLAGFHLVGERQHRWRSHIVAFGPDDEIPGFQQRVWLTAFFETSDRSDLVDGAARVLAAVSAHRARALLVDAVSGRSDDDSDEIVSAYLELAERVIDPLLRLELTCGGLEAAARLDSSPRLVARIARMAASSLELFPEESEVLDRPLGRRFLTILRGRLARGSAFASLLRAYARHYVRGADELAELFGIAEELAAHDVEAELRERWLEIAPADANRDATLMRLAELYQRQIGEPDRAASLVDSLLDGRTLSNPAVAALDELVPEVASRAGQPELELSWLRQRLDRFDSDTDRFHALLRILRLQYETGERIDEQLATAERAISLGRDAGIEAKELLPVVRIAGPLYAQVRSAEETVETLRGTISGAADDDPAAIALIAAVVIEMGEIDRAMRLVEEAGGQVDIDLLEAAALDYGRRRDWASAIRVLEELAVRAEQRNDEELRQRIYAELARAYSRVRE